jgi:RNA polymerase sigma-70 factor, ECF subfamily
MHERFNGLYQRSYEELRRLAAAALRGYPRETVSPTTLVHEAWMRLERTPELADTSAAHFKAIAAYAMRQVLVEHWRRRVALRRGGPGHFTVALDEALIPSSAASEQLLELDAVLKELRATGPQGERMESAAVLRWFGGCTVSEIGELQGISATMVERDWRMARAWLKARLQG